ncbi:hypothetical protein CHH75_22470 [Paenibacillus sp. 7541]|uniref:Class D sortase n=1 Tax=Paenibacillus campinasensis TaxID=66347 RepID=A0ABW9T619_9BACL|nr:class D sortase [Paenibacillus campinasensis]PAK48600.1 hypothetical protein CHH75_22470 [Paenibacillus sp. 7541]
MLGEQSYQRVKVSFHSPTLRSSGEKPSSSSNWDLLAENFIEGTQFGPLMDRTEFRPELGEAIGVLYVPQLDVELPIVEGTDDEMLERGVGHYTSTALPSDNEQILLSGHRDTVFRDFDQLSVGDRFVVKLPYGVFEYEIQSTDIVDKDDTTVIRPMGTEVLVVSTCYPFRYLGNAPERFIFYAYPVDFPLHS